jgi:hypothetical protein
MIFRLAIHTVDNLHYMLAIAPLLQLQGLATTALLRLNYYLAFACLFFFFGFRCQSDRIFGSCSTENFATRRSASQNRYFSLLNLFQHFFAGS